MARGVKIMDFVSFNSADFGWIVFALLTGIAQTTMPFGSSGVLSLIFSEYPKDEVYAKVIKYIGNIFYLSSLALVITVTYFIAKTIIVIINWVGSIWGITLINQEKSIPIGLGIMFLILAFLLISIAIIKKKGKNRLQVANIALPKTSEPKELQSNQELQGELKGLKEINKQLTNSNQQLAEALNKLIQRGN
jgi:hypothetical protein